MNPPSKMNVKSELSKEYRLRFAAMADYRNQVWKVLVRDFFQKYIKPTDVVLDLGSGWGEFVRNIRASKKFAMDLNSDSREMAGSEVEFIQQDCSQSWSIPADSLDVVFSSNFFEHLPDKEALSRTFSHAMTTLKPGGRLICMGPNMRFLSNYYWDFWDHHIPLSDRSIVEGLTLAGFKIETCVPRFLPYSMSLDFRPPVWLVGIYIRMPWIWPRFGRQFLIVARKPN